VGQEGRDPSPIHLHPTDRRILKRANQDSATVAGWILHGENLSPNLQAGICKLTLQKVFGWTCWIYSDE